MESSSVNNNENGKLSLEKRLFHSLHQHKIISVKEFKESWAFCNTVLRHFGKSSKNLGNNNIEKKYPQIDVVIDVAGGHGALGALFLILSKGRVKKSIVIDPAVLSDSKKKTMQDAWFNDQHQNSSKINDENDSTTGLEYCHESLYTALPRVLHDLTQKQNIPNTHILVVACHACQDLTNETLRIAERYGTNIAVMSCCQKDLSHGSSWKAAGKNMMPSNTTTGTDSLNDKKSPFSGVPIGIIMDLLSAGKMMSEYAGEKAGVWYNVKLKVIPQSITPQNRLIICQALPRMAVLCKEVSSSSTATTLSNTSLSSEATSSSTSSEPDLYIAEKNKIEERKRQAALKLEKAYVRAHSNLNTHTNTTNNNTKVLNIKNENNKPKNQRSEIGIGANLDSLPPPLGRNNNATNTTKKRNKQFILNNHNYLKVICTKITGARKRFCFKSTIFGVAIGFGLGLLFSVLFLDDMDYSTRQIQQNESSVCINNSFEAPFLARESRVISLPRSSCSDQS